MCAIGDALHDYDNDIVQVRGLQSTINDHDGISWLQFMLDRLQQIPCTPSPTNDDVGGMDSEVLKELVRAWQEVHDEKLAIYRHLVAVVRVHLDYRVKGQEPFIQPKLLKPWDSKASEPAERIREKRAQLHVGGQKLEMRRYPWTEQRDRAVPARVWSLGMHELPRMQP